MAKRLAVFEAMRPHEGNHPCLHGIEIVFDRYGMHEQPPEIDRLQDGQLAAFGIDADVGDLR
jgi:hypothetical protein